MKKYICILLPFVLLMGCGEDLPWQNEQYEKMIYILCNSSTKVFDAEYHFDGSVREQQLSLLCSGTYALDKDVEITLRDDTVLFDRYNRNNFDIDTASFAKLFSKEKYSMPTQKAVLKAGEFNTLLSVIIEKENLAGLSPDSIYFIPLAIDKVSEYSINPDNYNMLFRVHARNAYARSLEETNYRMRGIREMADGGISNVSLDQKRFHPLAVDEVRCFAGITAFDGSKLETVRRNAFVIKINEDNTLSLRSYYDGEEGLIIEQLGRPADLEEDEFFLYDNTYEPEQNRFRMHYRYKVWTQNSQTKEWAYSDWVIMQETDSLITDLGEEEE